MDVVPGTVIDRYTVESKLGEGGMAVVYKVRHNTLGSLHALKVLTITSPQIKERLLQEGRVQGQLRHTNIVQVTDVVQVGDAPGLVLEFVQGPTLDAYIEAERPTLAQADALAQGIMEGVAAAHAKNLVHRDLKPANILLQVSRDGLVPKIADFGLAKIVREGDPLAARTLAGATMGTPHYMALEQIKDTATVGPQADVFALGAILYELVTGKRAFDGDSMLDVFNKIAQGKYTPPRQLVPDLPVRMEMAINRALQTDMRLRVKSVDELRAIWNGERESLWDRNAIERVVSIMPEGAQRNTRQFNPLTHTLTQFSKGAVMGGGALFAVGGAVLVALMMVGAVAIGLWQMGADERRLEAPPADVVMAASNLPAATTRPAPVDPSTGAVDPSTGAVDPNTGPVDPSTIAIVGPPVPVPDIAGSVEPAAPKTEKPLVAADNPWGSPAPSPKSSTATATGGGGGGLPPDLSSGTPSQRIAALEKLASAPDATSAIGQVMQRDTDAGVVKRAYKLLEDRWSRKVGSQAEAAAQIVWAAKHGGTELRLMAVPWVGAHSERLTDLSSALQHPQPTVRRAAVEAIAALAPRTGAQAAARTLLEGQAAKESDGKTKKRIEDAISAL